jgi:hypothetical protein
MLHMLWLISPSCSTCAVSEPVELHKLILCLILLHLDHLLYKSQNSRRTFFVSNCDVGFLAFNASVCCNLLVHNLIVFTWINWLWWILTTWCYSSCRTLAASHSPFHSLISAVLNLHLWFPFSSDLQHYQFMWDFKFSRRRVWCPELSSGKYCRVKLLSTDVSEVRTASIIRDENLKA